MPRQNFCFLDGHGCSAVFADEIINGSVADPEMAVQAKVIEDQALGSMREKDPEKSFDVHY